MMTIDVLLPRAVTLLLGTVTMLQLSAATPDVSATDASVYWLAPERVTHWEPGVPGGIPAYTHIAATVEAAEFGDGRKDARSALQRALTSAGEEARDGKGRVVLLSVGTFAISGELYLPSRVVLRGAGPNATRIVATGNRHPVLVIGASRHPHPGEHAVNLAATAEKEGTTIELETARDFRPGDLVWIDEVTDNERSLWNPRKHPPGAGRNWYCREDRPITQVTQIKAVNGNTLTVVPALHIDFRAGRNAQASGFDQPVVASAGIEDLRVSSGRDGNIQLDHAAWCWVKHVESDDSYGSCIALRQSFRCEIRDSYLHDTYCYTAGGAGYGVDVTFGSSDNLVENSIVIRFNKVINCRASGGGNVIAYNYMDDGAMNIDPGWVETGLQASHYPTPHYELFEGNYCFNIDGDFTEGNAIAITFFRNQASGLRRNTPRFLVDEGNRRMAAAMHGHYFYNFVGNVLGQDGLVAKEWTYEATPPFGNTPFAVWKIGYWDQAPTQLDAKVGETMIRDGNFDYVTRSVHWHHTPGFSGRLPDSLYLKQKPAFFGDAAWPWVDPLDGAKAVHVLPAKARYDAGNPNG